MVNFPVHVLIKRYSGRKDNLKERWLEKIRIANEIESYINKKVEESDEDEIIFTYDSIAKHLGCFSSLVSDILYPVDGGDKGITVKKPK